MTVTGGGVGVRAGVGVGEGEGVGVTRVGVSDAIGVGVLTGVVGVGDGVVRGVGDAAGVFFGGGVVPATTVLVGREAVVGDGVVVGALVGGAVAGGTVAGGAVGGGVVGATVGGSVGGKVGGCVGGSVATGGAGGASTEMTNETLATLPALSAAVQVTVVSPTAKNVPGGTSQPTPTGPSMASTAPGRSNETVAPLASGAVTANDAGCVSAGGVWSVTVIGSDAVATFPAASCAEQRTSVVPSGKSDPGGGSQLTTTGPLTSSVAVGST